MSKDNKNKQRLLEETESLFQFVPLAQLKKSLYEVYSFYLREIDITILNPNFNKIAEDFYFLYNFLEKVEDIEERE
jgi:hypothetical protein